MYYIKYMYLIIQVSVSFKYELKSNYVEGH